MPTCLTCGVNVEASARFCPQCGSDLKVQQTRAQRTKLEANRAELDARIRELEERERQLAREPRPTFSTAPTPQSKPTLKGAPKSAPAKEAVPVAPAVPSGQTMLHGLEEVRVKLPGWALVLLVLGAVLLLYGVSSVVFTPAPLAQASPSPASRLTAAVVALPNATTTPTPLACALDSDCVQRGNECCPASGNGACRPLSAQCSNNATPFYQGCACQADACVPRYQCVQPTPSPTAAPSPTPSSSPTPSPSPTPTPFPAPVIMNLQALITTVTAEVSWVTDVAANSTIAWGSIAPGSDGNRSSGILYETSHYYKLEALISNTTYQYRIGVCRVGGPCTNTTRNFTTRASS